MNLEDMEHGYKLADAACHELDLQMSDLDPDFFARKIREIHTMCIQAVTKVNPTLTAGELGNQILHHMLEVEDAE